MTSINPQCTSYSAELIEIIRRKILGNQGWLSFDSFMQTALYQPQFGYYARDLAKISLWPGNQPVKQGDFATAPEISTLFGYCLAHQIKQILLVTNSHDIWEFGAGSGKLAQQILTWLARKNIFPNYHIVDISVSLKRQQQETLAPLIQHGAKITWCSELPEQMNGAIIGNELLDAMPVKLLHKIKNNFYERGVVLAEQPVDNEFFAWRDIPTKLHFPVQITTAEDYLSEIHLVSRAYIKTLAEKMHQAVAIFIDYGFDERQYYHPQRSMGTLICHHAHMVDSNPLQQVGSKDITAHVNFTDFALAGQQDGLEVLGYINQANFLINCGLLAELEKASLADKIMAEKLILEHEMGELFKVLAFGKNIAKNVQLLGFCRGDISYQL